MNLLKSVEIQCPYCGESISLTIDGSVEQQDYIEDCSVCCRPINLSITVFDEQVTVTCRHEDD